MRRGILFAVKKLNAKPTFFADLVDVVVKDVINEEETQFLKTLTRGQKLLEKTISKLDANTKTFPGETAWNLYDTYGFPFDLTQLICEESGLFIDKAKYEEAKLSSQTKSQGTNQNNQEDIMLDVHSIDELKSKLLNDAPKYDYMFESNLDNNQNYNLRPCKAQIKAIRYAKEFVDEVQVGQECDLLLDQTSFYSEPGGQTFDEVS